MVDLGKFNMAKKKTTTKKKTATKEKTATKKKAKEIKKDVAIPEHCDGLHDGPPCSDYCDKWGWW